MRWRLADEEVDGQAALFGVADVAGPEPGTGRLAGMEFLPVAARRILNTVRGRSPLPFRWTINVYRGCSHACTYCLAPDTPVLRADGGSVAIGDVRLGDLLWGTGWQGSQRRGRITEVRDRWITSTDAHRVQLADGGVVVAGADHRFLTGRGWKYVRDQRGGRIGPRPHLTVGDELLGPADQPDPAAGFALAGGPARTVIGIEALERPIDLVDLTTATGDFVAAGLISHNCFARPTHEYLGLNTGADFDRRIVVKINAVEKLRAELREASWAGEAVAMGTNTDPYQRCEGKYRLTRGVIGELVARANPFSVLTKSPLVLRDLDLLTAADRRTRVEVNFSIATLDERVWRATEPGTPHPRRRLDALRRLAQAGIRTGALIAPVLPGLSDSTEQLTEVADAIRQAGGRVLGVSPLHLRPGVREHFLSWLAAYDPGLHVDYQRRYAGRDYAPGHYVERLRRAVAAPADGGAGTPPAA